MTYSLSRLEIGIQLSPYKVWFVTQSSDDIIVYGQ
jgi:hypothetical protein